MLMTPSRSIPASQFCGKIFGFTDYRFGRSIWNGCYCGRRLGLLFSRHRLLWFVGRGCCTLSQAFNHPNSWHPQTFFTKEMLECTSSAASDQQSARKSDQQSARNRALQEPILKLRPRNQNSYFFFEKQDNLKHPKRPDGGGSSVRS